MRTFALCFVIGCLAAGAWAVYDFLSVADEWNRAMTEIRWTPTP